MRERAYQSSWERLRDVGLSMGGERESNSFFFFFLIENTYIYY